VIGVGLGTAVAGAEAVGGTLDPGDASGDDSTGDGGAAVGCGVGGGFGEGVGQRVTVNPVLELVPATGLPRPSATKA
jgi:hypothetical protein